MSPHSPTHFVFRWRDAAGTWTALDCWATSQAEAETYARRAGWPGHDGTRLGRYRAWLKATIRDESEI